MPYIRHAFDPAGCSSTPPYRRTLASAAAKHPPSFPTFGPAHAP